MHPLEHADQGLVDTLGRALAVMDRRGFLSLAGKGLTVAFALPLLGRAGKADAATPEQAANAYVHIGADNTITLMYGGSEMGQGSMSGLAQILAEELMVDWNQIKVEQSLVDPVVTYLTGGSSAIRGRYTPLRNAGAAARELLIAGAMEAQGDLNRDNFTAQSATVKHVPTGRTWTYGSLAALAAFQTAPANLRLTDPSKFQIIGKSVPRVDLPSKVDGSAKYGIDTWFPNMVFAAVKHCPVIGGTLAATPAKPSGAIAVIPLTTPDSRGAVVAGSRNAVAVVASNTWLAFRLASSLSVNWTMPASTLGVDSAAILAQAQGLMKTGAPLAADPKAPTGTTPADYAAAIGPSVDASLGTPTLDVTYQLPFLAHATMEPLACTARYDASGGVATGLEIWAPTQSANGVTTLAMKLTGLPRDKVVVHTTLLGGGLGRKIELDFVSQAIQVAMALPGTPVKLTWKREEDFAHDQYRPFALVNVKAKVTNGRISAWRYRNVSQSILGQRGYVGSGAIDSQAVEGSVNLPYDLGNHIAEWIPLPAGIPVGFWRSVGSSINCFVVESVMDELAFAAGKDPFQFRYDHLTNDRVKAVLWAADIMSSSWRNSLPAGHAWGVAVAESFGTVVAEVVEVSQPVTGSLRVHRVDVVLDCGTVINPDSVQAQMQGAVVHAMSSALWGEMTFTAGKANQTNFRNYRGMRVGEMPTVNVQIVSSVNPPSGVGEPGVPPLAPALANALYRITKTRVRKLPFFSGATMRGL